MRKISYTKKGFTLVEIIVAMAILVIVLGIIFPMFSSNLKTLRQTEIRTELQREGQYVIKRITESAMETKNIATINNDAQVLQSSEKISISTIEFATGNTEGSVEDKVNYNFNLQNGVLSYTKKISGVGTSSILCRYVQSIQVQPIQGNSFRNCRGVMVTVNLNKDSEDYNITSNIYFRNFEN